MKRIAQDKVLVKAALITGLTVAIVYSPALAETEAEFRKAIRELEAVKLGGSFKVEAGAFVCADKGKLMFVERMATGDQADQNTAQLIGARDCVDADEDTVYTRCAVGGFVFPQQGGRLTFSGYCPKGATAPVLYIRDDEVRLLND